MSHARRIYELALTAPEVDSLDEEEVEAYARQKARELHLDEEKIARRVRSIQPTTTEFKRASELCGGPQTL